ncbi:MAG: hypothetical protein EOM20_10940 [Spartobacteria bacterium]|nr:hypothetical protein [Spartobacteria bacterium]
MSAVLIQISVAIGGLAFLLSLALSMARGVTVTTAIFRGAIVMCLATLCVAFFFRFFTAVLYGFVKQKVLEKAAAPKEEPEEEPPQENPAP